MKIDSNRLQLLVNMIADEKLMSDAEVRRALCLALHNFPFLSQVELADSLHYHIHVEDVAALPHQKLMAEGGQVVNEAEGYIKYAFEGGVNFIFSHIPVAQKEKQVSSRVNSWLDHIGIDIRSDDKRACITFQQIPLICSQQEYLFTRQGDGKNAVECCHMQVKEKYWVYPDEATNYEFAFGPLVIHESGFGIDLRPANPFITAEENTSCCGSTKGIKQKPAIFIN